MKINKKVILIIVTIIFACITFLLIFQTYAKYLSSATGETNVNIARWNIKVNNIPINDNTSITSTIAPVFPGNDNIEANVLAPTAEGYFDLVFDFSGVDVSFMYTISSIIDESSPIKDFVIVGYSVDGGDRIDFTDNKISDTVLLTDNVNTRIVRIYIKWIDDESASMSNEEDTLVTTSPTPAIFKVNINFTQIV